VLVTWNDLTDRAFDVRFSSPCFCGTEGGALRRLPQEALPFAVDLKMNAGARIPFAHPLPRTWPISR